MNFLSYRPFTEIEFLSNQTMVFATGQRTTAGTLATITPAADLTFVLLGAQVSPIRLTASFPSQDYEVELRNEANVRNVLGGASGTEGTLLRAGYSLGNQGTSIIKGDTLDGDGIKTYTLEVITVVKCTIAGTIWGYTRNT